LFDEIRYDDYRCSLRCGCAQSRGDTQDVRLVTSG
jgi:hypothetical protein